jgi:hypothetical protein
MLATTQGQSQSIFERLIQRMVAPKVWQGCDYCELKDKCYVKHNIDTFRDQLTGPKVIERLGHLYKLATLRNQLHITMRDLRSALAYMLVGEYSCTEIKFFYANGENDKILQGYYFNSWCGNAGTQDRLLHLLKDTDIALATDVSLDRGLDFLGLEAVDWMQFEERSQHEQTLLQNAHAALPGDTSLSESQIRYATHRNMVAMLKRRAYFERRGEQWQNLQPYRAAYKLMSYLNGGLPLSEAKIGVIHAINRGEGLHNPAFFKGQLAMQVRNVPNGTIKSYRLFPADVISIEIKDVAKLSEFVEHSPQSLLLRYQDGSGLTAELDLNLDLFEMLYRLNQGYRPSVEALQGYYLSLNVFKNVLASAPYQESLLTSNGRDYKKIVRQESGVLKLELLTEEITA